MPEAYFAILDKKDMIKKIEHQEVTEDIPIQVPENSRQISADIFNMLNENMSKGYEYKIIDDNLILVETLRVLQNRIVRTIVDDIHKFRERGLELGKNRFSIEEHMMVLMCVYAHNNSNSYYNLINVDNELIRLSQKEVDELKANAADYTSRLVKLEIKYCELVYQCTDTDTAKQIYEKFAQEIRSL